jgi:hypothetical protein
MASAREKDLMCVRTFRPTHAKGKGEHAKTLLSVLYRFKAPGIANQPASLASRQLTDSGYPRKNGCRKCGLVVTSLVGRSNFREAEVNCTRNAIELDHFLSSDVGAMRA